MTEISQSIAEVKQSITEANQAIKHQEEKLQELATQVATVNADLAAATDQKTIDFLRLQVLSLQEEKTKMQEEKTKMQEEKTKMQEKEMMHIERYANPCPPKPSLQLSRMSLPKTCAVVSTMNAHELTITKCHTG